MHPFKNLKPKYWQKYWLYVVWTLLQLQGTQDILHFFFPSIITQNYQQSSLHKE